jgi:hypothetical protein
MVTVIRITPAEAAALAASSTVVSSSATAVGQLCRHRGCINEVNFEKRGGLCRMHQVRSMDGERSDSGNDSDDDDDCGEFRRLCSFRGCISDATTDEGLCDRHSTHISNSLDEVVDRKRALPSGDSISNEVTKKRKRRQNPSVIDLSGVPPQQPIPKSGGRVNEGASKYTGVWFNKRANKWIAQITIEEKQRTIGYYENEEEAAVDYARAVYKYKVGGAPIRAPGKVREQKSLVIDLRDVPPQPPIPRSESAGRKDGSSKYAGVHFVKKLKKWNAQITIEGKQRSIGYYENEEEAAKDYARAAFKYKVKEKQNSSVIDLTDVPPQPPIPRSTGRKDSASKYTGVTFNKQVNKWQTRIVIEGKQRSIGCYDDEEEAAVDYARAVYKFKKEKNAANAARDR